MNNSVNIESELTHGCDGPLTPFVIITRAIELARSSKGASLSSDDIANGLYEAMVQCDWVETSCDAMATGS